MGSLAMLTAFLLVTLLQHDRILVGLHQTGSAGAPPKQTPFLETQLERPLTERLSSIGALRITTARRSLFSSTDTAQLAQAAEFRTGLAWRANAAVEAVAYIGATGGLEESRFRRQAAAGVRIQGNYEVTVGRDEVVGRRGLTLRVELTQPIDGTPLYLVAQASVGLSQHRDVRDSYRVGIGMDLKKWFRK